MPKWVLSNLIDCDLHNSHFQPKPQQCHTQLFSVIKPVWALNQGLLHPRDAFKMPFAKIGQPSFRLKGVWSGLILYISRIATLYSFKFNRTMTGETPEVRSDKRKSKMAAMAALAIIEAMAAMAELAAMAAMTAMAQWQ